MLNSYKNTNYKTLRASLEITTLVGCSVNCSYCPQAKLVTSYFQRSKIKYLSLDDFKKCMNKLPSEVDIHFSGMAEPWLNPQCSDMLLYAASAGHRIKVSTTLQGMTLPDAKAIGNVRFKQFRVHLPSAKKDENIKIDNDYFEVLSYLLQHIPNIELKYNGDDLHRDVQRFIGANQKVLTGIIHSRVGNVTSLACIVRKQGKIMCKRNLRQNVLLPNGDVLLCCMDYANKHIIGNLLTGSYQQLFESEEFNRVGEGLVDDTYNIICRYCYKAV